MPDTPNTLLTEKELRRFADRIQRLAAADLEILSKMLWKRRQEQQAQADETIHSAAKKKE